jgi:hypothetical protein
MNVGKIGPVCKVISFAVLVPLALSACTGGTVDAASKESRPSNVPASLANVSTLSSKELCEKVIASVADAGFEDEAWVTCDHENAQIHSDSYASHEMMTGIVGTNEQIPVPAPGYYANINLSPSFSGEPKTRDSSLAIAVNGIPIFDYSAGGEMSTDDLYYHQPHLDAKLLQQLDECGGHTGRGDDYHYHALPTCMIDQMKNKDENPIIAWGFDGFPMYGNKNPDGSTIAAGALDVCNGQLDPVFGYRYHTSESSPYIIQCLVGEVDLDTMPTIGIERPSGVPVSVENLTFEHDDLGTGLMTYDYQGQDYYIKSTATEDESCFDIEWKTVTNGGVVESGEYCHFIRTGGGMGGPPAGGMGGDGMGAPPGEGMGAP